MTLGSLIDVKACKDVRNAVCAIGYLMVPLEQHRKDWTNPEFRIVGTGFLIAENLVITCRHVLQTLHHLEDHEGYPNDQMRLSFVYPHLKDSKQWQAMNIGLDMTLIPEREGMPDLAFIRIAPKDRTPDSYQCVPVKFSECAVQLGDHIAIWGYPDGEGLHLPGMKYDPNEKLVRTGPVLQQGFVSAGTPFDVELASEYLLDVRTTGGMSGGPVFNPRTGEVIGVHYKGNKMTTSVAVALRKVDIDFWLEELKPTLALPNPNVSKI